MAADDFSFLVDKEFSEIPGYFSPFKGAIVFQEFVDRMSFVAIHMDFLKHGKFDVVGLFSPSFYFKVGGRFLVAELVAREGENVEASASVLLMELDHLFVVSVSVSEGGDIDNHYTFLTSCWHMQGKVSNAINISCTKGPQRFA